MSTSNPPDNQNYTVICPQFDLNPEIYLWIIQLLPLVTQPLNLLSIYCILCKSPPAMKNFKWHLLNHRCWALIVDLCFSLFTTPVLFIPLPMGYPRGIFSRYFQMDSHTQTVISNLVVSCSMISVVHLFMYRYQNVWYSKFFSSRYVFIVNSILMHAYMCVPIAWIAYQCPDQTNIAIKYNQIYSCVTSELLALPGLQIYEVSEFKYPALFLGIGIVALTVECMAFIVLTFHILNNKVQLKSKHRYKAQKRLVVQLILQVFIPFLFILFPCFMIMYAILTQLHGIQKIINILVILMTLHGAAGAVVLIYLNRPYRIYMQRKLGLAKGETSIGMTEFSVFVTHTRFNKKTVLRRKTLGTIVHLADLRLYVPSVPSNHNERDDI